MAPLANLGASLEETAQKPGGPWTGATLRLRPQEALGAVRPTLGR